MGVGSMVDSRSKDATNASELEDRRAGMGRRAMLSGALILGASSQAAVGSDKSQGDRGGMESIVDHGATTAAKDNKHAIEKAISAAMAL